MSNSVESHTHSIIHWAYFFLLLSGSECPANGEQRRGKRERGMERQEEERMRAYIKAVPSDICALGVERHYEYQYEPMERKHRLFSSSFSSHWAIHAHKKSIQVNETANLGACA